MTPAARAQNRGLRHVLRDGILLAPVTAQVMCAFVLEGKTLNPLDRFSPQRF
jgi:hypothetical protein